MDDVEYKSLYILNEIPQILYDLIARIAQNLNIVKNLTMSQKLQNGYNGNIFPDN